MQRMAARVFTYVLVDDAETYTAAELAEGLSISLAAVSGAIRELLAAGLVVKGRRASTRADVYRLNDDDIWGSIMLDRTRLHRPLPGHRPLRHRDPPRGPGRDRLIQTAAFMDFMKAELAVMRERWNDRREDLCTAYVERRRSAPPR